MEGPSEPDSTLQIDEKKSYRLDEINRQQGSLTPLPDLIYGWKYHSNKLLTILSIPLIG